MADTSIFSFSEDVGKQERGVSNMSKKWELNQTDIIKIGKNFLVFGAPALAVFFGQLASGVELKKAFWLAMFVFYQLLADIFRKLQAGK